MSEGQTLDSVLDGGRDADRAIVVPDGPTLTYGDLKASASKLRDSLRSAGIGSGDRVASVLPNGPAAIVAFLGTAMAGTAAPLNPAYTEDEFRFYLSDINARALIVSPGQAETARKAAPDGVCLVEMDVEAGGRLQLKISGARAAGPARDVTSDDVALLLYSSGTTGRAKRVPLRHRNIRASVANIVRWYRLQSDDVSLVVMPLFHVHGLVAAVLSTFASGGSVVVPDRFNPLAFARLVETHRPTWYTASPSLHQLALSRRRDGGRLGGVERFRFVRSCSAKLPETLAGQLEAAFGVPVLEAYGMTEASHQMASNPLPPKPRVPGSVGPGTGVQIAIMDEAGRLAPSGAAGEVVIQGPNVIDHYDDNPEADKVSFTDGWFRTGDLGVLDANGYLTLIGRIKEMINRGGEKIAPKEIDEVLLAHPAVAEAAAFGMPHATWGEEVAAAVVLKGQASEAELLGHCRKHLADFKAPKRIHIVEAIPKTAVGKIQRRQVADLFKSV